MNTLTTTEYPRGRKKMQNLEIVARKYGAGYYRVDFRYALAKEIKLVEGTELYFYIKDGTNLFKVKHPKESIEIPKKAMKIVPKQPKGAKEAADYVINNHYLAKELLTTLGIPEKKAISFSVSAFTTDTYMLSVKSYKEEGEGIFPKQIIPNSDKKEDVAKKATPLNIEKATSSDMSVVARVIKRIGSECAILEESFGNSASYSEKVWLLEDAIKMLQTNLDRLKTFSS